MGVEAHDDHGHHDDAHDGHDAHGHDDAHASHSKPLPFAPHDSPWQITAPIMLLGTLALISGYLNAAPFGWLHFEHWTESSIGLPLGHGSAVEVPHPPEFAWGNAAPGLLLVLADTR